MNKSKGESASGIEKAEDRIEMEKETQMRGGNKNKEIGKGEGEVASGIKKEEECGKGMDAARANPVMKIQIQKCGMDVEVEVGVGPEPENLAIQSALDIPNKIILEAEAVETTTMEREEMAREGAKSESREREMEIGKEKWEDKETTPPPETNNPAGAQNPPTKVEKAGDINTHPSNNPQGQTETAQPTSHPPTVEKTYSLPPPAKRADGAERNTTNQDHDQELRLIEAEGKKKRKNHRGGKKSKSKTKTKNKNKNKKGRKNKDNTTKEGEEEARQGEEEEQPDSKQSECPGSSPVKNTRKQDEPIMAAGEEPVLLHGENAKSNTTTQNEIDIPAAEHIDTVAVEEGKSGNEKSETNITAGDDADIDNADKKETEISAAAEEEDFEKKEEEEERETSPTDISSVAGANQDLHTLTLEPVDEIAIDTEGTSPANPDLSPPSPSNPDETSPSNPYSASKPISQPTPPYAIRASPGKGLGLFATRPLIQGTRILCETPLLLLPNLSSSCIIPTISALPLPQQRQFFSLSRPHNPEQDAELGAILAILHDATPVGERSGLSVSQQVAAHGIVWANSYAVGNQGEQSGVFSVAARINHSCIPNVYHSWNERIQRLTVYTVRDIEAGEELFTTYIQLCLSREVRNDGEHLGRYGFECVCRACDPTTAYGRRSEKRRARMEALDAFCQQNLTCSGLVGAENGRNAGFASDEQALIAARELAVLVERDGIVNMELTRCLHQAGDLARLCGKFQEAFELARRALAVSETCAGVGSPYYEEYRRVMLEAESRWDSSLKRRVVRVRL